VSDKAQAVGSLPNITGSRSLSASEKPRPDCIMLLGVVKLGVTMYSLLLPQ